MEEGPEPQEWVERTAEEHHKEAGKAHKSEESRSEMIASAITAAVIADAIISDRLSSDLCAFPASLWCSSAVRSTHSWGSCPSSMG